MLNDKLCYYLILPIRIYLSFSQIHSKPPANKDMCDKSCGAKERRGIHLSAFVKNDSNLFSNMPFFFPYDWLLFMIKGQETFFQT